ncbi:MAG TPA: signal peptidase I [Thermodesulfobacteriota bacterium]|nr:signal peptidase I [Thermodesulfobacteriota bacterium]
MLGLWSKEAKARNRAKLLISQTQVLLSKNSAKINPESAAVVNKKIAGAEMALAGGNTEEIIRRTSDLEGASRDYLSRFAKSKLRQNVEALVFAVALALLIRTFVFQPFKIPSGSMIPTLLVGDHLLVSKFIYGTKIPFTGKVVFPIERIKRGDVIVFTYPNAEHDPSKNNIYYIKRVVGVPGDRIELDGRQLVINGQKVPIEFTGTYMDERNGEQFDEYREDLFGDEHTVIYRKGRDSTNKGSFIPVSVVPEGQVFVMGDNRDNSQDSRFWGFVPFGNIAGKAFLIHWSWDFESPDIANKVRWNRILSGID